MSQPNVWFITGASSGFGRHMTELVLKKGDIAIATLRKPESLADLAEKHSPEKLLVLKLDVTKPQEILDAFAEAEGKFGRIDVVFNNAAQGALGEIESMPEDIARKIFDVNFWGATNVSKEAVRFFREVNKPAGGRLLQVSSLSGLEGQPVLGMYDASKFALEGMSEALAEEIDPEWNIKITIIEPGGFRTNLAKAGAAFTPPSHPAYTKPTLKGALLRNFFENDPVMPGDTGKAVEVIYRLAALPDPPLHFPLGNDCIAGVRRKTAKLLEETDRFEAWSQGLEATD